MAVPKGTFVYDHFWGELKGLRKLSLKWNLIDMESHVFVSASEAHGGRSTRQRGPERFVGEARYTVHNVAPGNGVLVVLLNIEWKSPLPTVVEYLVINK